VVSHPHHRQKRQGTLEGLVSNEADADLARLTAGNVPGVSSFTSRLEVATAEK
jgi:osmotically-inducible protein OsmY